MNGPLIWKDRSRGTHWQELVDGVCPCCGAFTIIIGTVERTHCRWCLEFGHGPEWSGR